MIGPLSTPFWGIMGLISGFNNGLSQSCERTINKKLKAIKRVFILFLNFILIKRVNQLI